MSCRMMPGRSWPREMRPVPMAPTLMRFEGDAAPSTEDGTIDGKPLATTDAARPEPAVARKVRRLDWPVVGARRLRPGCGGVILFGIWSPRPESRPSYRVRLWLRPGGTRPLAVGPTRR